jgi:signal transduction histidine kinase
LDNEIALAFFRVVQESLHNIAKHSRATDVQVEVTVADGDLTLIVCDNGAGFDIQESKVAAGLGLVSMRERFHLIGGEFAIESAPGAGTRIWARTPLNTTTLSATNP